VSAAVEVHHVVTAVPSLPADAPTLVLSNALGLTHHMWDKLMPLWAKHFRVVRYDTRGHGDSPVPDGPYTIDDLADDVIALLDRLELDRVHFAGLALGGMTGLHLAARNPDRIGRLAVVSTSSHLPPAELWFERAETVRAMGGGAVADAVVSRWYSDEFARSNPDVIHAAHEVVRFTPREGYAGCCEAIATTDLRASLPSITAPTLVIGGEDDPVATRSRLTALVDSMKDAQLLMIDSAGQLITAEQPKALGKAVVTHVEMPDERTAVGVT
jgi:3-oxoadipate enol-lactonase